jgi:hypothetical protein
LVPKSERLLDARAHEVFRSERTKMQMPRYRAVGNKPVQARRCGTASAVLVAGIDCAA